MIERKPRGRRDRSASFEEFFGQEHLALYRALVLVTRNPSEAEDLVQEAFVKMWQRWGRVATLDDPRAYLHRTAMNALFDVRRRALRFPWRAVGPARRDDPADLVEARDGLERAILHLPPRQRAALVVTALLGYSSTEAASVLGVEAGTVRRLVSLARKRLARRLKDEEAHDG